IQGHIVYDSYFGVCRVHSMPPALFLRQVGLILGTAVDELRRSGLSLSQIGDIISAASLTLRAGVISVDSTEAILARERFGNPVHETGPVPDPVQTAFYRW